MNILGISCFYHEAAACIVKDGQLLAACEEERFTRVKHDLGFPVNSIEYCLATSGLTINDIDYVAFYEKPFLKFERVLFTHLHYYPTSFLNFIWFLPDWIERKLAVSTIIKKELQYKGKILYADHHLAHAASSYLVSPFEEAAILTVDGVGEWATTTWGIGRGNKISIKKEIQFPHSLGLLYSTLTGYLGFPVNDGEGTVMGLAPYGEPTFMDHFKKIISIKQDGSIELDMKYFAYPGTLRMFSRKFIDLFGPPRKKGMPLEQRHKDIAYSLQATLEEALLAMVNHIYEETRLDSLCMAGGVALNCVANGKVLLKSPFKNIYIQPAAGDDGAAIGAAFYVYNTVLNNKREYVMTHAYHGPQFSAPMIKNLLQKNNVEFEEHPYEKLVKIVAGKLAEDKIVGWFQGRMEIGPRALGNRSILASPINPEMKDILNKRVKFREVFRPYAPSVLLEELPKYFHVPSASPFMLLAGEVVGDKKSKIPAVTHVDGTARVQTVTKEDNGIYYDLIKEFYAVTGVPVILNTSFNVKGEPIVCTPLEAYNCFKNTDMDYLVMDRFLIQKKKK